MTIHVLGTVNGIENEGMRNVATHLAREFMKEHRVLYSGLKQLLAIIHNSIRSDVTLIFARANKAIYWLARVVEVFNKQVWIFCVQKPDPEFLANNDKRPLCCGYFTISQNDTADVKCVAGKKKHPFTVGINTQKFTPVNAEKAALLKVKYGFSHDKLLVIHVGHCSVGRGLDDFLALDGSKVNRLVVASGMFEDAATIERLQNGGVNIYKGFLEHIEETYQMADAYLFPTRSAEFVISIPLSVMESLACGTPVIGYKSFTNLNDIHGEPHAITLIDNAEELSAVLPEVVKKKEERTLLAHAVSWSDTAHEIFCVIKESIN